MRSFIKLLANLNIFLGGLLVVFPMIFLGIYASGVFTPGQIFAENVERENEIIAKDSGIKFHQKQDLTVIKQFEVFQIPEKHSENYGNKLIIPSININTLIWENWNGVDALGKGTWRMPYHGAPDRNNEPIVLAAHRWGGDNLSWDYREKHLFLNLPDLKVGQEIKIIWFGKEYVYRVSHTEVNEEVSRSDDLILITCKDYNSLKRVFVYASRV